MNEPDNNNVVSIGDDFRSYDRRHWSWRDRARAAREDQRADLSDQWITAGNRMLAPDHVMSFQLTGPTKADEERRRRRNRIRLEEKFGLREKHWF
jgi:hypothetical protein